MLFTGTLTRRTIFGSEAGWVASAVLAASILALPLVVILANLVGSSGETWEHLASTVLPLYVSNTLLIAVGTAVATALLGVSTAWLITMCEFPGRRFLSWALVLPLAFPGYVAAFVYGGLFDYAGPVQEGLRALFGWGRGDYFFPPIRSTGGAVLVLSFVLYPYVYLLVRHAFLTQSVSMLEAGRILGGSPWKMFRRVAFPLARPALVGGAALAAMETLNDLGVVELFGVATFTTGIYRTWFGLGDLTAATRLSAFLMLAMFLLLWIERCMRGQRRFHPEEDRISPLPRYVLKYGKGWFALLACTLPLSLGFVIPAATLVVWHFSAGAVVDTAFFEAAFRSVALAAVATTSIVGLALVISFGLRLHPRTVSPFARIAGLGYAIPGVVVAVGVLVPFSFLDGALDSWTRSALGVSTGLLLTGSVAALLFAYAVRFLAAALGSFESAYARIPGSLDAAARTLGVFPGAMLRRVHVPMLRSGVATAAILVFVEVMKELPATLILRPFDFTTLAVRAFEMADEERIAEAALPALTIVAAGTLPLIALSRSISRRTRERAHP